MPSDVVPASGSDVVLSTRPPEGTARFHANGHIWTFAKRSVGLFSHRNPFRLHVIAIVTHPTFNNAILFLIILNSIAMGITEFTHVHDNPDSTSYLDVKSAGSWRNTVQAKVNALCLWSFAAECLLKIVAQGFAGVQGTYLRDHWNKLDFFVVLLSMADQFLDNVGSLSALRAVRALRPLRSMRSIPGMHKMIEDVTRCLPKLRDTVLLLSFAFMMFGIMGQQLFSGMLHGRCRLTPHPVNASWTVGADAALFRCLPDEVNLDILSDDPSVSSMRQSPWSHKQACFWPLDEDNVRICSVRASRNRDTDTSFRGYACPRGYANVTDTWCGSDYDAWGNARFAGGITVQGETRTTAGLIRLATYEEDFNYGLINFDNFLRAVLTVFQVITLEGWTDIMYMCEDATGRLGAQMFFVFLVAVGNWFALSLFLAVFDWGGDADSDGDELANDRATTGMVAPAEGGGQGTEETKESRDGANEESGEHAPTSPLLVRGLSALGFTHHDPDPDSPLTLLVESWQFETCSTLIIVANTIVLATDRHGIDDKSASQLEIANFCFSIYFGVEMVVKIFGLGFFNYLHDSFNTFDAVIVIASLIELLASPPEFLGGDGAGASTALRSFRLFRMVKLAKNWTSMQLLMAKLVKTLADMVSFIVLLCLFIFIFAMLGIELFSNRMCFDDDELVVLPGEPGHDSCERPRLHFDSVIMSLVTIFVVLTGENWNTIMYAAWRGGDWTAPLFFVLLVVFGQFILMNLFLAVLLSNFSTVAEEVKQNAHDLHERLVLPHQLDHPLDDQGASSPQKPAVSPQRVAPAPPGDNTSSIINVDGLATAKQAALKVRKNMAAAAKASLSTEQKPLVKHHDEAAPRINLKVNKSGDVWLRNIKDAFDLDRHLLSEKIQRHRQQRASNNSHGSSPHVLAAGGAEAGGEPKRFEFLTRRLPSLPAAKPAAVVPLADHPSSPQCASHGYRSARASLSSRIAARHLALHVRTELDKNKLLVDPATGKRYVEIDITPDGTHRLYETFVLGIFDHDHVVRRHAARLAHHPHFDAAILCLIFMSCVVLVLDSPLDDPDSGKARTLYWLNVLLTVVFGLECVVKVLADGFCCFVGTYLTDPWNKLDFLIVVISVFSLAYTDSGVDAVSSLRALRALRPLRVIHRFKGMKTVITTLLNAVPENIDVLAVCSMIFLIFSIFAVSFLKGALGTCSGDVYDEHIVGTAYETFLQSPKAWNKLSEAELEWFGPNSTFKGSDQWYPSCDNTSTWSAYGDDQGWPAAPCCRHWLDDIDNKWATEIPTSKLVCLCWGASWTGVLSQNFDNVFTAFMTFTEIASTEGWTDVMFAAVDSQGADMHPVENNSPWWILFFVVFMCLGCFVVMNLFVGVIIQNFDQAKEGNDGAPGLALSTPEQHAWAKTQLMLMRLVRERQRYERIKPPQGRWNQAAFRVVRDPMFERFITACILANVLCMSTHYFGEPDTLRKYLDLAENIFVVVFNIELFLKLKGLRMHYFALPYGDNQYARIDSWNLFDFVIVVTTDLGLITLALLGSSSSASSVTSIVRTARMLRLFRLINGDAGMKHLIMTLVMTLPGLFNVLSILILLLFIFAIMGVQLFAKLAFYGSIDEHSNFRTIPSALLLLVRFSTGEAFNEYMHDLGHETQGCVDDPEYDANMCGFNGMEEGTGCEPLNGCGNLGAAILFMFLFNFLIMYIFLNLFIGVVLEGFDQTDESTGLPPLKPQEVYMIREVFQQFDRNGTEMLPLAKLTDFMRELSYPWGLPKGDLRQLDLLVAMEQMDLRVVDGNKVDFVDLIVGLTRRTMLRRLKDKGQPLVELGDTDMMPTLSSENSRSHLDDEAAARPRLKGVSIIAATVVQRAFRASKKNKMNREDPHYNPRLIELIGVNQASVFQQIENDRQVNKQVLLDVDEQSHELVMGFLQRILREESSFNERKKQQEQVIQKSRELYQPDAGADPSASSALPSDRASADGRQVAAEGASSPRLDGTMSASSNSGAGTVEGGEGKPQLRRSGSVFNTLLPTACPPDINRQASERFTQVTADAAHAMLGSTHRSGTSTPSDGRRSPVTPEPAPTTPVVPPQASAAPPAQTPPPTLAPPTPTDGPPARALPPSQQLAPAQHLTPQGGRVALPPLRQSSTGNLAGSAATPLRSPSVNFGSSGGTDSGGGGGGGEAPAGPFQPAHYPLSSPPQQLPPQSLQREFEQYRRQQQTALQPGATHAAAAAPPATAHPGPVAATSAVHGAPPAGTMAPIPAAAPTLGTTRPSRLSGDSLARAAVPEMRVSLAQAQNQLHPFPPGPDGDPQRAGTGSEDSGAPMLGTGRTAQSNVSALSETSTSML